MNLIFPPPSHIPLLLLPFLTLVSPPSPLTFNLPNTNTTNARSTFCFRTPAWTHPHWDGNVDIPCRRIINRLRVQYVIPDEFAEFEFLPLGQAQVTAWQPVRTPFKLVLGMLCFFLAVCQKYFAGGFALGGELEGVML